MTERLSSLARKFWQQEEFSRGYSPLYARLFGIEASWFEASQAQEDPLVAWLLQAGQGRKSLDISLLLNAGLHREVLAGEPGAVELAHYFPTTGGSKSAGDPQLAQVLRRTILAHRHQLTPFIRQATVQTNETGRGLCWLLPLLSTGWPSVHLLDLGASAGLNLVAEMRAYRLVEDLSERVVLDIGQGDPVQFLTQSRGDLSGLGNLQTKPIPHIASRTGYDLAPFQLDTKNDRLDLVSFVWGDQVTRMKRLREGMAALKQVASSRAPVLLYPVDLPIELGIALNKKGPPDDSQPAVLYNTYMATYLHDKGDSLFQHIESWAVGQKRPVVWLQWEPARNNRQPPEFGWCAWTVDLWHQEEHHYWQLGWVHPHGVEAEFTGGFELWNDFCRQYLRLIW